VQAFISIKDLGEYQDAELIRKKIAACFAVFVKVPDSGVPKSEEEMRAMARIEPGSINYMNPGDEITTATPPQSEGYSEYMRVNLQRIASAYNLTYESLSGDLSNTNYSSGRMGWIEASRGFLKWQTRIIIPLFCDRVFDWLMDAAIITGQLREKASVSWTPPRRELIDPAKEVKGLLEMARAGFTSWQEVVRELGWDKEQLLKELLEDKDMWDKAGLKPMADPRFDKESKAA